MNIREFFSERDSYVNFSDLDIQHKTMLLNLKKNNFGTDEYS